MTHTFLEVFFCTKSALVCRNSSSGKWGGIFCRIFLRIFFTESSVSCQNRPSGKWRRIFCRKFLKKFLHEIGRQLPKATAMWWIHLLSKPMIRTMDNDSPTTSYGHVCSAANFWPPASTYSLLRSSEREIMLSKVVRSFLPSEDRQLTQFFLSNDWQFSKEVLLLDSSFI